MVRRIIKYSYTGWSPHTRKNIQSLEAVQRRVAWFVKNDHGLTSTVTAMLQSLEWPILKERQCMATILQQLCYLKFYTIWSVFLLINICLQPLIIQGDTSQDWNGTFFMLMLSFNLCFIHIWHMEQIIKQCSQCRNHCSLCSIHIWYTEQVTEWVVARVHNFRGRGEYPTLYTAAKHTALSYDAISYWHLRW